ncbi:MAG TPA: glycosyl hydrolase [Cyclobacteriaceae bacterium]
MKNLTCIIFSFIFLLSINAYCQNADIEAAVKSRSDQLANSLLSNYPVRNVGPVEQGGRISDIEVVPGNPKHYYVGYASGGIFYTKNNGITFDPIFENQGFLGIGDFALAPSNPQIIYVGTGEKNSSRSSYAGSGIYRSNDGGKTWSHLGLSNTQHIGRIIVHPTNPETVWVASLGALYTNNVDRGIYKSTDGGKTWHKTLFVNDSTGAIDLVLHPQNPNQLLASTWERSRKAWDFKEGGPGSSIYRSEDGGNTWVKSAAGFPEGNGVGRIGLEISASNPDIVYALLDNQEETREEVVRPSDGSLQIQDFISMTRDQFQALDDKKLDAFIRSSGYPQKYNARVVKREVRSGKYEPKALAEYFGDANAALFNTNVKGAEVYRSDDGGKTWSKANSYALDGVYFTYGYYFGEVRVDPKDSDKIYIFGVPLLKSLDGGKTYHRLDTMGRVHVDHQALWINPDDPEHLLLGNDGGLYQSYDEGASWLHINNVSVGQFYSISVDMEKPYNVYGGLQDNGVRKGSSTSIPNRTESWDGIFGGDGMFVYADPRNSNTVYAGSQFGFYMRLNLEPDGRPSRITPRHDIGEPPLRYNWRTPIMISPHNADVIYMAAQKVYRSMNQGDDWESISGDLTKNLPNGNVPYSTITSMSESKFKFGLVYIGTDDGNIQVTKNGGGSWELINNGLPVRKWVSGVFASPHDEGTVFAALNGYREDDFKTYVYMSADYGKTWTSVKGNLPESVANVIIQDPVQPELLYTGLDIGSYVSFDKGKTWSLLSGIPNAPSYDMVVHPRDYELVVGTHGRSVYVADAKPLQAVAEKGESTPVIAFEMESMRYFGRWGERRNEYTEPFTPSTSIMYYVGIPANEITVTIKTEKGEVLREMKASGKKGFQKLSWDLKKTEYDKKGKATGNLSYIERGKYTIELKNGTSTATTTFELR